MNYPIRSGLLADKGILMRGSAVSSVRFGCPSSARSSVGRPTPGKGSGTQMGKRRFSLTWS
jgi:hypothetical protein